uniref:Uncharacterized protein n=1 Tax=Rousettus aegyptiacus TaxID=9407 RepID=A0A7J8D6S4_ROUAE|nr:hypothetical protein HJG63_008825 [Rousettus aegyptiacus]
MVACGHLPCLQLLPPTCVCGHCGFSRRGEHEAPGEEAAAPGPARPLPRGMPGPPGGSGSAMILTTVLRVFCLTLIRAGTDLGARSEVGHYFIFQTQSHRLQPRLSKRTFTTSLADGNGGERLCLFSRSQFPLVFLNQLSDKWPKDVLYHILFWGLLLANHFAARGRSTAVSWGQ